MVDVVETDCSWVRVIKGDGVDAREIAGLLLGIVVVVNCTDCLGLGDV